MEVSCLQHKATHESRLASPSSHEGSPDPPQSGCRGEQCPSCHICPQWFDDLGEGIRDEVETRRVAMITPAEPQRQHQRRTLILRCFLPKPRSRGESRKAKTRGFAGKGSKVQNACPMPRRSQILRQVHLFPPYKNRVHPIQSALPNED